MTGSVRDYLVYIFGFIIVVVGFLYVQTGAASYIGQGVYAPFSLIYETALAAVMAIAAIAAIFARDRLSLIILVGSVGYMVSLFFVLFRAPDLALTQLIVETVSVSLFLLCFYHLPKLKKGIINLKIPPREFADFHRRRSHRDVDRFGGERFAFVRDDRWLLHREQL